LPVLWVNFVSNSYHGPHFALSARDLADTVQTRPAGIGTNAAKPARCCARPHDRISHAGKSAGLHARAIFSTFTLELREERGREAISETQESRRNAGIEIIEEKTGEVGAGPENTDRADIATSSFFFAARFKSSVAPRPRKTVLKILAEQKNSPATLPGRLP
jgi:hypothetical protein